MLDYTEDTDLAGIKLVATDMDLTLLHSDKSMPSGMPARIRELAARGVLFCAASGRPAPALRASFPENADTMAFVADNGGSIYCQGELIYKSLIDRSLYHEVLDRIARDSTGVPVLCAFERAYVLERDHSHHDELSVYYKDIRYVEDFDAVDVDSNKVSGLFPNWDSPAYFEDVFGPAFSNRLYVTCAGNEWIDFMNLGVDKGTGIRRLAEYADIKLSDVAAFGDTYNDIPMLDIVGHSFAVANAAEHMDTHARFRCPSNDDEGVLTVIDAILAAKGL